MSDDRYLPHDWYPVAMPPNVVLGEGSWLYSSFAFRHFRSRRSEAVRIGRACGIYAGSFFDLGPEGDVTVGEYSTLVGVIIAADSSVRIGSYCFLSHEVVIADRFAATPSHRVEDRATRSGIAEPSVSLGDDVWIGAGAVLLRGAQLGDGAIVGAGAVVDFEIPAHAVVAGNPARIVGRANGSTLRGDAG